MHSGTFDVPFLALAHERYPMLRTPCLEDVHERLFGEAMPPGQLASAYCCGHFVVSRDRVLARPAGFYQRLVDLVHAGSHTSHAGGPCEIGDHPCYAMEFLYHRVFGEALMYPQAPQPTPFWGHWRREKACFRHFYSQKQWFMHIEGHKHCFMRYFGVKTLSGTLFPRL